MIPKEEETREYAKYAARVREIVQAETNRIYGRTDPYLLSEISRSATMPIGIWISYHAGISSGEKEMRPEEMKEEVNKLSKKFELIESNGFLRPKRNLEYTEFQSLKSALIPLGYRYELGRGFVKA
jgi:hypothetical protein